MFALVIAGVMASAWWKLPEYSRRAVLGVLAGWLVVVIGAPLLWVRVRETRLRGASTSGQVITGRVVATPFRFRGNASIYPYVSPSTTKGKRAAATRTSASPRAGPRPACRCSSRRRRTWPGASGPRGSGASGSFSW
jgi:hypothetical protein